jgi:hypothetical protein
MALRPLAVLLAFTSSALAHSWYPYECCSEKDCYPVAVQDVRVVPGGWNLSDGTHVKHHEARPSPDGKFHVCRMQEGKGELIRLYSKPACFWAPVVGS